ncbi:MAG: hypothetical protein HRU35_03630, partial [Rickettsiaceae bacterium]|nr:hypothetical protein [Rickettsiaceae bacterium]
FYFYAIFWLKKEQDYAEKESWDLEPLEQQLSIKLTRIHNQQTAIFIVFTIFIASLSLLLIIL